ncbi:MAG TPA: alpha/beta fold hydrolase [Steroidobacteraceae bacterium]|nr:alpha/beta fold hydrolase [Steroidobacteraceae bacterium]
MKKLIALLAPAALTLCLLAVSVARGDTVRSGTFSRAGASLYWEEHGDPAHPPLVLLHGFGESMAVWRPYQDALAVSYDVVLLDLRGHGRSTNSHEAFSFKEVAEDLLALMDHLHHARFRAVGASSGGIALLHAASRAPGRFEGLVLVSAAPDVGPQARARVREIAADKGSLDYLRQFAARGDAQVNMLQRQFAALADSSDAAVTSEQLAAISAPTLIVHGDRDEFFPVEVAVSLYRSIRSSYLRVYPNDGHEPIYNPRAVEDFSHLLLEFFSGKWQHPDGEGHDASTAAR